MFGLLANGPGPPYPTSHSPLSDWLVWGGSFTLAALLGGWAFLNWHRPKRGILAGVAVLSGLALVAFATLFVMVQALYHQEERFRQERQEKIEHLDPETEERSQP